MQNTTQDIQQKDGKQQSKCTSLITTLIPLIFTITEQEMITLTDKKTKHINDQNIDTQGYSDHKITKIKNRAGPNTT